MSCILPILEFKKMSVEPVVAPDEEPYAIKEADLPQILEEYDRPAAGMSRDTKRDAASRFSTLCSI